MAVPRRIWTDVPYRLRHDKISGRAKGLSALGMEDVACSLRQQRPDTLGVRVVP